MEKEQNLQALSQRILVNAASKLGGARELAKFLAVGDATLGEWIAGRQVPPGEIILKAVSQLVDEPHALWQGGSTEPRTSSQ